MSISERSFHRFRRLASRVSLLALVFSASEVLAQADPLDLGSGAALVDYSSEFSTDWRAQWSALALLDGTVELGWCSHERAPFPHTFVIELGAPHRLDHLTFHNSPDQESRHPGISTRGVEVWTSLQGPGEGFRRVAGGEVARGGSTTFEVEGTVAARWVKILVRSNWGHDAYTELMEVEAKGAPLDPENTPGDLSGVYVGRYGKGELRTTLSDLDGVVTGCYSGRSGGRLSGRSLRRSAELEWRQEVEGGAGLQGALLLVVSDAGELSGLWYGRGSRSNLVGRWTGSRLSAPSGSQAECPAEDLSQSLLRAGQATLYGVRFESDSAVLSSAAEPTLRQVLSVFEQDPGLHLEIAGHTDATASDRHNQVLSRRRAESVRAWLVERGVAADQLVAVGHGESQPVADNGTPQGRRLNRRVEIVVLHGPPAR